MCPSPKHAAPWHILLIEDNAEDLADMRQMLLRGGTRRYRFSEAVFGAEGVRKVLTLEHGPVDCVLLDYALPDMDALEVLAALCGGDDIAPCPVVVMTGAAVEEGQPLLSAGAQDFIGKRWSSPESLTRAVENAVDRYTLQRERRHAVDSLRGSEERYRTLFNSIDAGYAILEVLFDADHQAVDARYLQVNPAFVVQTGVAHAEGQTLRSLVPGIEPVWIETFGTVAHSGVPIRLEQFSAALDRCFDVYVFRVGPASSRHVAVLFNDITERKASENALIAAKAAAESANRAKSDFLLNMSHELRSPLSSILGFAQLLEAGKPPPTDAQRDSVDQILSAGWYLLGLINEILDLTTIESGKTLLVSRVISMAEIMQECRSMIEPQAQRSGIAVEFPRFEGPCLVIADPMRTKQVLINLLTNAIKYNRAGGQVQVGFSAVPGRPVRVTVQDTGHGLSQAQLDQLFQPFNRLGQEFGAEPGTGIGLMICKRLVEQMGGCMGADSTLGVGSCFWFELDAADAVEVPASVQQPGPTVLCIEAANTAMQEVEILLALYPGASLLRARDIASGVAIARSARPDVILISLRLCEAGGMDARLLLGRDPATSHIPLIALGDGGSSPTLTADPPVGFVARLAQPLQPAAFMDALARASQPQPTGGQRATA